MVAHTGYLVFARALMPRAFPSASLTDEPDAADDDALEYI
jgi:hypothetical protein